MLDINRGEIYYADLSTGVGSEQSGNRPVVIIQNDVGNFYSPTTIIAPLTSRIKTNMPTHVYVELPETARKSVVLTEQVRTIDKKRLGKYVGKISDEELNKIDDALLTSFGINRRNNES